MPCLAFVCGVAGAMREVGKTVGGCALASISPLVRYWVLLASTGGPAVAAGAEVDGLVDGVLARQNLLVSCRLEYESQTGVPGKTSSHDRHRLVLMGSSWRLESSPVSIPGLVVTWMNHNGKFIEFRGVEQRDDTKRFGADVFYERDLDTLSPKVPVMVGSLWNKCTGDYIAENRQRLREMPNQVVDGVSVNVIELDVSSGDVERAIGYIRAPLDRGAILRLFIAPGLGYAMPRVEHVAVTGRVIEEFVSRQFVERCPGLYFPSECQLQAYEESGGKGWFVKYSVIAGESFNESIADSAFVIEIPAGTIVADNRRPDRYVEHRMGDTLGISGGDWSEIEKVTGGTVGPSNWGRYLLLAGNVVLLMAVGCVLIYKWMRRSRDMG